MPRYFFNTVDGARVRDIVGTEFRDHHKARVEAIGLAGRLLADEPDYLAEGQDFHVVVTDRDGAVLFTVVVIAVDTWEEGTGHK